MNTGADSAVISGNAVARGVRIAKEAIPQDHGRNIDHKFLIPSGKADVERVTQRSTCTEGRSG